MDFSTEHPTEDVMERYLFGSLPDWEVEHLEEHLLVVCVKQNADYQE
jgi:hypothetical protein